MKVRAFVIKRRSGHFWCRKTTEWAGLSGTCLYWKRHHADILVSQKQGGWATALRVVEKSGEGREGQRLRLEEQQEIWSDDNVEVVAVTICLEGEEDA